MQLGLPKGNENPTLPYLQPEGIQSDIQVFIFLARIFQLVDSFELLQTAVPGRFETRLFMPLLHFTLKFHHQLLGPLDSCLHGLTVPYPIDSAAPPQAKLSPRTHPVSNNFTSNTKGKPKPKPRFRRPFERHPQSQKKKKIHTSPKFRQPKTLHLRRHPKYPQKSAPRRNKLDHYAITKVPLTIESTMKKTEDNTLVFIVDVKANKHQIKQAVKKL
ncbi:hypothetical protein GH733_000243 [Mirounga leonina]|nr:hypothetical protein GH733_000243 [Mirounga leonina]